MSNRRITRLAGATPAKSYSSGNVSLGETWFVYMEVAFDSAHVGDQSLFSLWDGSAGNSSMWLRRRNTGNTLDLLDYSVSSFSPIISVAHTKGGIDRILITGSGTDVRLNVNGVETIGVGSDRSGSGWAYVTDGSAVPVRWGSKQESAEQLNGFFLKAAIGVGTTDVSQASHKYYFNDNGGSVITVDQAGSLNLSKGTLDAGDVSTYSRNVGNPGWTNGSETFDYNFSLKYAGVIDAGQSNMLSRASAEAEDLVYVEALGAQQLAYSTQSVANAIQPLDHVDETVGDMSSWLVFVNNLMSSNFIPVDYELMMIPVAEGGTNVAYWAGSGNTGYDQMITSVSAFEALNAENYVLAVRWLQGEADASAGTSVADYKTRFGLFRGGLIADVSSIAVTTPFLMTEITGPVGAGADAINQALLEISQESLVLRLTSNDGLVLQDTLHYDAASNRLIGERNFAQYEASQTSVSVGFTLTGIPDGSYKVMVVKFNAGDDPSPLLSGDADFSGGSTSVELPVLASDEVTLLAFDGSRVLNGFDRVIVS